MSRTKNELMLAQSRRLPYRIALSILPLHLLGELKSEARLTWLRVTRPRRDRRFAHARELLVNVGCGSSGRSGWVNVDCVRSPGVNCVCDCRTAIPLPSASARGIFSEHFLEHLDYYEEAPRFLKECRRVLTPGGTLRLIVPDGAKYLTAYCTSPLADFKAFSPLIDLTPEDDIAPFSIERTVVPFRTKMEVVNFHFRQSGQHRFSYDYETLECLLRECGFEDVSPSAFRETRLKELAIDSESRATESLIVEASAPR
jgi:Methyltransferase domain